MKRKTAVRVTLLELSKKSTLLLQLIYTFLYLLDILCTFYNNLIILLDKN